MLLVIKPPIFWKDKPNFDTSKKMELKKIKNILIKLTFRIKLNQCC